MEEKTARFCLQFNTDDPVQRYAYEVIASKGRKKSAFISEAVKFYMENSGAAACVPDRQQLRKVVGELLEEMLSERGESLSPKKEEDSGNEFADMLLEGLEAFE